MANVRTLITVSHSLQRADYGEQPVWMGIVLAAMLGQMGLDGGGFSYSLGALGNIGKSQLAVPLPTLKQFHNPVPDFIPVARIADMLLNPGEPFHYNGQALRYPDIRLVYWADGNPFHRHQDLNRLRQATMAALRAHSGPIRRPIRCLRHRARSKSSLQRSMSSALSGSCRPCAFSTERRSSTNRPTRALPYRANGHRKS
ncbi:biotin/methionine sulfoxide reductase [Rhizobium mongolense]|uniref:Biotin/methionine sulfoxide reductase n=1 Tax=Rhizobium mongolense TaxID=57676 RepID=A0ABR6IGR3_9HYPH|nr:biotin/methionine sulfoxide reductase [Rhizobium mongolense]